MGELIKGNFGRSSETPRDEEESHPENVVRFGDETDEIASDQLSALKRAMQAEADGDQRAEGAQDLMSALSKVEEAANYLDGLKGISASQETTRTAEQYWRESSSADLARALLSSGAADWSKYPVRYNALLRELGARFRKLQLDFGA